MISVQKATQIIQHQAFASPTEEVLLSEACGRVLREPVLADRDFPPFHRVTMDGIALRFAMLQQGITVFAVAGTQHAGETQQTLSEGPFCLEVMTGTILPDGSDTVIRYEDIHFSEKAGIKYATLQAVPELTGLHVHRQGTDRQAGDLLLSPGRRVSPSDIGVMASVGKAVVKVSKRLSVAVISTGNELVEVHQTPLLHQIRRSNAYAVGAAIAQAGATYQLFHLPDSKETLRTELAQLLHQFDCLVVSGGVSMGKADFVPGILAELGVQKLFHQVAQRPGKPLWFGKVAEKKAVFALPGNPVSTFMCCYRYVVPFLKACAHPATDVLAEQQAIGLTDFSEQAVLSESVTFKPPLTYFLQVQTFQDASGRWMAWPCPGGGSGDLANLLDADAFLELPPDRNTFDAGEVFPLIRFRPLSN